MTRCNQPADALARALGIQVAEATTVEETMPEETMTETKPAKKSKTTKKSKAPKAAAPKSKKQRTPKEAPPRRVFAFRLHDSELEAIHRTAGARNASRFIRAVAAAFAAEDEGAFKAVVKEAKDDREA